MRVRTGQTIKPRPRKGAKSRAAEPSLFAGEAPPPVAFLGDLERKIVSAMLLESKEKDYLSWCRENVYFKPQYKACVFEGPYDPDLTPFWIEPMEALLDSYTREIKVLKCSQAGATENLGLMFMRYSVARLRRSCMIVQAQQEQAMDFFEERIVDGIRYCVKGGEALLRDAKIRSSNGVISFDDMLIVCTWGASLGGVKGRPMPLVICDEASTYKAGVLDKYRKRLETWQSLSKFLVMSAMDKFSARDAADDPMLGEFERSDQRHYHFPDKGKGQLFRHEMGYDFEKKILMPYGLKWSPKAKRDDGAWDLEAVEESAYYLTPGGRRITTEQRNEMLRNGDGQWVRMNPDYSDKYKGYHVPSFVLPWTSYGKIARRFVDATSPHVDKPKLRIFVFEDLAEKWIDGREMVRDDELMNRRGDYAPQERPSAVEPYKTFYVGGEVFTFLTVDVQKDYFRGVAREWIRKEGKLFTGLIEEGEYVGWDDLDDLADQWGVDFVCMDNNYEQRRQEVRENVLSRPGFMTSVGKDASMNSAWVIQDINPYEGTRRQRDGATVKQITFDTDFFKTDLQRMIRGEVPNVEWKVPREYRRAYWREVLAEEKQDGKWTLRRGFSAAHAMDCEVLQLLLAALAGIREWQNK